MISLLNFHLNLRIFRTCQENANSRGLPIPARAAFQDVGNLYKPWKIAKSLETTNQSNDKKGTYKLVNELKSLNMIFKILQIWLPCNDLQKNK